MIAVLSGAHTSLAHIPQSHFTPHQSLSTLTPMLPSLRPDIILVCYVFNFHISSAFPFSCSPSALWLYSTEMCRSVNSVPHISCSFPNTTVFFFYICMHGKKGDNVQKITTNTLAALREKGCYITAKTVASLTLSNPINSLAFYLLDVWLMEWNMDREGTEKWQRKRRGERRAMLP